MYDQKKIDNLNLIDKRFNTLTVAKERKKVNGEE